MRRDPGEFNAMIRHVLFTMILVMAGVIFYFYDIKQDGEVHRSIQIKGVFVLVDELDLHSRLRQLSVDNNDRREFLKVVRAMLDKEPYLGSSTIRYSWPDEVVIEISEVSPLASINQEQLLLKDCRMIRLDSDSLSVPLIDITVPDEQLGGDFCKKIINTLAYMDIAGARHIEILGNGDYVLYIGRTKLIVGKDQLGKATKKIGRISMLVRTNRLQAEYVDLRYMSGAAIKRVVNI